MRTFCYLLSLLFIHCALAAPQYIATKVAQVEHIPWAIEFIDNDSLIVNQKNGTVVLFNLSNGQSTLLYQLAPEQRLSNSGQGGLLDVTYHAPSSSLYFTYSKQTDRGNTLALAKADFNDGKINNWQDIFIANATSGTQRHFGSRISIINSLLFITIGDRGVRDNGQDLSTHAGTVLRLTLDGKVPSDNPFVNTKAAKPEIWSYGHRNPQGLFYDESRQQLWSIEHGPRGGDEINLIIKGENYGWARASHGKEYWGPVSVGEAKSLPNMQDPKLVYTPSIAPSNLILYRGSRYPELDGKLLAGALKLTHISVLNIANNNLTEESRLFEDLGERVRDITIGPDDYIYFSTDNGNIYRIDADN